MRAPAYICPHSVRIRSSILASTEPGRIRRALRRRAISPAVRTSATATYSFLHRRFPAPIVRGRVHDAAQSPKPTIAGADGRAEKVLRTQAASQQGRARSPRTQDWHVSVFSYPLSYDSVYGKSKTDCFPSSALPPYCRFRLPCPTNHNHSNYTTQALSERDKLVSEPTKHRQETRRGCCRQSRLTVSLVLSLGPPTLL